jgi:hypothetical protein
MSKTSTNQPTIPYVAIPPQWHPPGDRLDSEAYNVWVDKQLALAADPKRWLIGLLVSVNEAQIKSAILRGDRLVEIVSEVPPNLTARILEAAGDRLQQQGYKLPNLSVTFAGVGR